MLVMNKDSYDKIPEEYKATFDEIWCADQVSYDFAEMFAEEDAESQKDGIEEYGIQEIEPDIEKFTAIADQLDADWIAEHSNIDAQSYYDLTMKLYQEGVEKFSEK